MKVKVRALLQTRGEVFGLIIINDRKGAVDCTQATYSIVGDVGALQNVTFRVKGRPRWGAAQSCPAVFPAC